MYYTIVFLKCQYNFKFLNKKASIVIYTSSYLTYIVKSIEHVCVIPLLYFIVNVIDFVVTPDTLS